MGNYNRLINDDDLLEQLLQQQKINQVIKEDVLTSLDAIEDEKIKAQDTPIEELDPDLTREVGTGYKPKGILGLTSLESEVGMQTFDELGNKITGGVMPFFGLGEPPQKEYYETVPVRTQEQLGQARNEDFDFYAKNDLVNDFKTAYPQFHLKSDKETYAYIAQNRPELLDKITEPAWWTTAKGHLYQGLRFLDTIIPNTIQFTIDGVTDMGEGFDNILGKIQGSGLPASTWNGIANNEGTASSNLPDSIKEEVKNATPEQRILILERYAKNKALATVNSQRLLEGSPMLTDIPTDEKDGKYATDLFNWNYNKIWTEEVNLFQGLGKTLSANLVRMQDDSDEQWEKYLRENPDVLAALRWTEGQKLTEGDWNTKKLTAIATSVVPSIITTKTAGMILGTLKALNAFKKGKGKEMLKVTGKEFGRGFAWGSGIAGGVMEGIGHLDESIEYLTNDRLVNSDVMEEDLRITRDLYKNQYFKDNDTFYHPGYNKTFTLSSMLNQYQNEKYYSKDGGLYRKGMSDDDAIDASTMATIATAVVNGYIEKLSAGLIFDIATGNTIAMGKGMVAKKLQKLPGLMTYNAMMKRMGDITYRELIRGDKVLRKHLLGKVASTGTKFVAGSIVEGVEEVLQSLSSQTFASWGWKDEGFKEFSYGGEEFLTDFVGGMLGAMSIGSVSGPVQGIKGSSRYINWRDKKFAFREGANTPVVETVKTKGKANEYVIYEAPPEYQTDKNGELIYEADGVTPKTTGRTDYENRFELKGDSATDPQTGKPIKTRFKTFKEAFKVAEALKISYIAKMEKLDVVNMKEGLGGSVEVIDYEVEGPATKKGKKPTLKGKKQIIIKSKDGDIIYRHKKELNKKEAETLKTQYENYIANMEKIAESHGGIEQIEKEVEWFDKDISEQVETDDTDNVSQKIEKYNKAGEENIMVLGFMGLDIRDHGAGFTKGEAETIWEEQQESLNLNDELESNPEPLINLIKERPQILQDLGINKDQFYQKLGIYFDGQNEQVDSIKQIIEDYESKLANIPVSQTIVEDTEAKTPPTTKTVTPPPTAPADSKPPTDKKVQKDSEKVEEMLSKGKDKKPSKKAGFDLQTEKVKTTNQDEVLKHKRGYEEFRTMTNDGPKRVSGKRVKLKNTERKFFVYKEKTGYHVVDERTGYTFTAGSIPTIKEAIEFAQINIDANIKKGVWKERITEEEKKLSKTEFEREEKILDIETEIGDMSDAETAQFLGSTLTPRQQAEIDVRRRNKKEKLIPIMDALFETFEGKIQYRIIEDPELIPKDKEGSRAWIKGGIVYFNLDLINDESPFHEFSHPFIYDLKINNNELFKSLVDKILRTKEGAERFKKIQIKYDEDSWGEELLAFTLQKLAKTKHKNNTFYELATKLWVMIKEYYKMFELKLDFKFNKLKWAEDGMLSEQLDQREILDTSINDFKVTLSTTGRFLTAKLIGQDAAKKILNINDIYAEDLNINTSLDAIADMIANKSGLQNIKINESVMSELIAETDLISHITMEGLDSNLERLTNALTARLKILNSNIDSYNETIEIVTTDYLNQLPDSMKKNPEKQHQEAKIGLKKALSEIDSINKKLNFLEQVPISIAKVSKEFEQDMEKSESKAKMSSVMLGMVLDDIAFNSTDSSGILNKEQFNKRVKKLVNVIQKNYVKELGPINIKPIKDGLKKLEDLPEVNENNVEIDFFQRKKSFNELEDSVKKDVELLAALQAGVINVRYGLIDNLSQLIAKKGIEKSKNVQIASKDLAGRQGLKDGEKTHIRKFIDWYNKKYDGKSNNPMEWIQIYEEYNKENDITFFALPGYKGFQLNHRRSWFKDMKNETSSYRMNLFVNHALHVPKHHDFEFLRKKNTGKYTFKGSGLGWYEVYQRVNGDMILHEYQTDILDYVRDNMEKVTAYLNRYEPTANVFNSLMFDKDFLRKVIYKNGYVDNASYEKLLTTVDPRYFFGEFFHNLLEGMSATHMTYTENHGYSGQGGLVRPALDNILREMKNNFDDIWLMSIPREEFYYKTGKTVMPTFEVSVIHGARIKKLKFNMPDQKDDDTIKLGEKNGSASVYQNIFMQDKAFQNRRTNDTPSGTWAVSIFETMLNEAFNIGVDKIDFLDKISTLRNLEKNPEATQNDYLKAEDDVINIGLNFINEILQGKVIFKFNMPQETTDAMFDLGYMKKLEARIKDSQYNISVQNIGLYNVFGRTKDSETVDIDSKTKVSRLNFATNVHKALSDIRRITINNTDGQIYTKRVPLTGYTNTEEMIKQSVKISNFDNSLHKKLMKGFLSYKQDLEGLFTKYALKRGSMTPAMAYDDFGLAESVSERFFKDIKHYSDNKSTIMTQNFVTMIIEKQIYDAFYLNFTVKKPIESFSPGTDDFIVQPGYNIKGYFAELLEDSTFKNIVKKYSSTLDSLGADSLELFVLSRLIGDAASHFRSELFNALGQGFEGNKVFMSADVNPMGVPRINPQATYGVYSNTGPNHAGVSKLSDRAKLVKYFNSSVFAPSDNAKISDSYNNINSYNKINSGTLITAIDESAYQEQSFNVYDESSEANLYDNLKRGIKRSENVILSGLEGLKESEFNTKKMRDNFSLFRTLQENDASKKPFNKLLNSMISASFEHYTDRYNRLHLPALISALTFKQSDKAAKTEETPLLSHIVDIGIKENNKWFLNNIIHSIIHSSSAVQKNGNIYIADGASNANIQGNKGAGRIYNDEIQAAWDMFSPFLNKTILDSKLRNKLGLNAFVAKYIELNPTEHLTEKMINDLKKGSLAMWFKEAISTTNRDYGSLNKANTVEGSILNEAEKTNTPIVFSKTPRGIVYNGLLASLFKQENGKYIFENLFDMTNMKKIVSDAIKNYETTTGGKLKNMSGRKGHTFFVSNKVDVIKGLFEKSPFEAFLAMEYDIYNNNGRIGQVQLTKDNLIKLDNDGMPKIYAPSAGIWYTQGMSKVLKNQKKLGLSIRKVIPPGAVDTYYQVKIKNQDKITGQGWERHQKLLDGENNKKTIPHTRMQVNRKLQRAIELGDLSVRTEKVQEIHAAFTTAWEEVQRLPEEERKSGGKAEINKFRASMLENLPTQLLGEFERWFNKNHAKYERMGYSAKSDPDYKRWMNNKDMDSRVVSWANDQEFHDMYTIKRKGTDEKELSIDDKMVFGGLGIYITAAAVRDINFEAKIHFENDKLGTHKDRFDTWVEFVARKLNKRSSYFTNENLRELIKHYNRVNSSVATNGEIVLVDGKQVGTRNQKNNLFITKYLVKTPESSVMKLKNVKIDLKGPENPHTGQTHNTFEKNTLYEMNYKDDERIYYVLSDSDIYENQGFVRNAQGELIKKEVQTEKGKQLKPIPIFGQTFEKYTQEFLEGFTKKLRKADKAIAFARGDGGMLYIVDVTEEDKKDAEDALAYFANEELEGYIKDDGKDVAENIRLTAVAKINALISGSKQEVAENIAVHKAVKEIYPYYLNDPKGGTNVYDRLKIPFTPVTVSQMMPSFRVDRFDYNNVEFAAKDGSWVTSAVRNIKGLGDVYILDGNSLTSQGMFNNFETSHGLYQANKAKTVIYHKEGKDIVAIKHEHVIPKANFVIRDKKTKKVLFTIDENRNIYDADGKYVDMVVTKDEAKIGGLFDVNDNSLILPGTSIGFTKYDDKDTDGVGHGIQVYNYIHDPAIREVFYNNYYKKMIRGLKQAYMLGIPNDNKSIPQLMQNWYNEENMSDAENWMPYAYGHIELNSGIHPTTYAKNDVMLFTKKLEPEMKLEFSDGGVFEIRGDVTGQLNEGEVSLSFRSSKFIRRLYKEKTGNNAYKQGIESVNKWLKENPIYVQVSRYPVNNKGGVYMARVVSMHNGRGLVDLNYIDVKVKLEADGDGDTAHIELMGDNSANDNVTMAFRDFYSDVKVEAISLPDWVHKDSKGHSILSTDGRNDLIYAFSAGYSAIGELVNVQSTYGTFVSVMEDLKIDGRVIRIKQPNEKVQHKQGTYKGKKGAWEGDIETYMRIWAQAAMDNAKFGLLDEWDFRPYLISEDTAISGGDKVLYKVFEYADTKKPISFEHYLLIKKHLSSNFKKAARIRSGLNRTRNRLKSTTLLQASQEYLEFVEYRSELMNDFGLQVDFKNIDDIRGSESIYTKSAFIQTTGSRLTYRYVLQEIQKGNNKAVIVNPTAEELSDWIARNNLTSINIAGSRQGMVETDVKNILKKGLENFNQDGIIISGGQYGPDIWGLEVGKEMGYKTGGTAPKGFKRQKSIDSAPIYDKMFLESFGLVEHTSERWGPRTLKNVQNAQGTIIFAPTTKMSITQVDEQPMAIDELIATAPAKVYNDIVYHHKLDKSPRSTQQVSVNVHRNAHNLAMEYMTLKRKDFFNRALMKDGKDITETKYRDSEIEKGIEYAENMGSDYYSILNKTKVVGSRTQDTRDFEQHTIKWSKVYDGLSNVARVAATYHFMQGFPLENVRGEIVTSANFAGSIPTVNKNSWAETTLEPSFMKAFYDKYNLEANALRSEVVGKARKMEYEPLNMVDKGCK